MLTVEKYALGLVFYSLMGMLSGLGKSYLEAARRGAANRHKALYLGGAAITLVYSVLGLGMFDGGHPLYVYIPVVLIWWGSGVFGAGLFPVRERGIGIPLVASCGLAVGLFHIAL